MSKRDKVPGSVAEAVVAAGLIPATAATPIRPHGKQRKGAPLRAAGRKGLVVGSSA